MSREGPARQKLPQSTRILLTAAAAFAVMFVAPWYLQQPMAANFGREVEAFWWVSAVRDGFGLIAAFVIQAFADYVGRRGLVAGLGSTVLGAVALIAVGLNLPAEYGIPLVVIGQTLLYLGAFLPDFVATSEGHSFPHSDDESRIIAESKALTTVFAELGKPVVIIAAVVIGVRSTFGALVVVSLGCLVLVAQMLRTTPRVVQENWKQFLAGARRWAVQPTLVFDATIGGLGRWSQQAFYAAVIILMSKRGHVGPDLALLAVLAAPAALVTTHWWRIERRSPYLGEALAHIVSVVGWALFAWASAQAWLEGSDGITITVWSPGNSVSLHTTWFVLVTAIVYCLLTIGAQGSWVATQARLRRLGGGRHAGRRNAASRLIRDVFSALASFAAGWVIVSRFGEVGLVAVGGLPPALALVIWLLFGRRRREVRDA